MERFQKQPENPSRTRDFGFSRLCHGWHRFDDFVPLVTQIREAKYLAKIRKTENYDDPETGERKYQKVVDLWSRFDPKRGYKFYYNRSVVEGAREIPLPPPEQMQASDIGHLRRLSYYLIGDSGMLGYRGNGNVVKTMTPEMMSRVTGLSKRSTYRFIQRVGDMHMMRQLTVEIEKGVKETQFYLNPLYHAGSPYIPLGLYLIFRDQIDRYLPGWAIEEYRLMELREEPD